MKKEEDIMTKTEFWQHMALLRKEQNDIIKWAIGIPTGVVVLMVVVLTLLKGLSII